MQSSKTVLKWSQKLLTTVLCITTKYKVYCVLYNLFATSKHIYNFYNNVVVIKTWLLKFTLSYND